MSSKIAFLPISASEKAMFNFKALSEQTNAFILALTKSIVACENFDQETIKACIEDQITASFGNGKGKGKKAKKEKSDIKHPKSAYIYFCTEKRAEVKEQNPDMSAKEITVQLAAMWKEIDDDTKKVFQELADKDKSRYEAEKAEKSSSSGESDSETESESKAEKKAEKKSESKRKADKKTESKKDKKAEKEADKKAEKKSESKGKADKKSDSKKYTSVPAPPQVDFFEEELATKFLKSKTCKEIIDWMKANSDEPTYHTAKYCKNTKDTIINDALSVLMKVGKSSF